MAIILDGNKAAEAVYTEMRERIDQLENRDHFKPGVAILMVGSDPSSKLYVNMIVQKCEALTIRADVFYFGDDATTEAVVQQLHLLNEDCNYCGIIVQFPVPRHLDALAIREAISPEKDVDSAGSVNIGKFYATHDCYIPCTPKGMHRLLKSLNLNLTGKHAVVIGRSHVVGKPLADMLLNDNMTVTVCHSKTVDLGFHTRQADVIMAAAGVAHLITADMVKPGAVVIDAGINMQGNKVVGDVDTEQVKAVASAITPVPGGVGPMTIAMLIENILTACTSVYCSCKVKMEL